MCRPGYDYMELYGNRVVSEENTETKAVILLGSGPSYKECPFDTEVWVVNNAYKKALETGHVDKLFLAHKPPEPNLNWAEIEDLSHSIEIVSLHPQEFKVTPYPLEEIVEKFGSDYFTDTISYMIAYALYKEYREIYLYGVDMGPDDIYKEDIPGVEYWLGLAVGRRVKIGFPDNSYLCRTPTGKPYGF